MKYQTVQEWEQDEAWKSLKGFAIGVIISTLIWFMFFLMFCGVGKAEITEETAIRCIIGEAASEGYAGLLAVSDALQNRGHTNGVYGCKAKHIDKEPKWVWERATKAWTEAKTKNPTNGATHWESTDFKKPYWTKSMTKTVIIGKHEFYK